MAEITLYSRNGKPVAYIADDGEQSIYLWDGRAVVYIYQNDKVYGWNGEHLGFFVNGIIYDMDGYKIGFLRSQCPSVTRIEPVKLVKKVKHVKRVKRIARVRPVLKAGYSDLNFEVFLEQGES